MATREKGRKKTKQEAPQEASQQFRVTDPISMADLENIHTRRGKYPSRPPSFRPKTWELAQKEKEERVFKERRERPLSTPLGTTSTDAMDTEEAQEFSKEIAEKVIERELKKQKYEQYQQVKQTSNYQIPKSITIPVPDLNKPRPEKVSRPTSVLSNFDVPIYEEMMGPKEGQPIKCSMSVTPGLSGMKSGEGARPKDSFKRMSAFQDYMSTMMSALNNPWKPRNRKTATPTWSAVPPLVYVSATGTPVSDTQSKKETGEKYVPMNFSAVDKTVLTPQRKRNENKEIHDKMKEEIEKMDQAVADSSSFIKKMKDKDPQQIAFEKTVSDFWDTSDVPQGSLPVKIALYPSLESLNEEPKDELTETEHEYYDKKRKILVEKMAIANDIYLAHLQNYDQGDPKSKSQKFLFQFNEVGNRLHKQFDIVAERLRLPLEQPLMTYPSLGNLMDAIQQEDMGDKNREYFQEMAKEVKIKDDIARKVLNNRLSVIKTPAEKGKTNLQYKEYQKESKKLLDFCEKMMGKREKETDFIELEQPEGVPKVKEISKEKLNEKLKEIIDQPQYVKPIGENTLPPYYSREMSRYEPPNPIKQKEREDLLEKVREMTSEESKGGKGEKSVEVDTDLSWDHEGLKPLPKAPKDRLNGSPKPPRAPRVPKVGGNAKGTFRKEHPSLSGEYKEGKYPEPTHKENKVGMVDPQEKKQAPEIVKKNGKNGERWDFESPENLVDKKTARWIEEQNEFLGKQKKKSLREIGKKGTHQYLIQMALLRFYRSRELTTILVMNKHPNI